MFSKLFTAALMMFGLGGSCWAQDIPDLTAEQWREDVDALVAGIERDHREAWNFVPRAEVMRLADEAAQRAGAATDAEMLVALQRIAAAVGDGHTFVDVSGLYSRYPFDVSWIEGDFYIVRSGASHGELLGGKLVAIDDTPVDQALEKLLSLVPRNENRFHEIDALSGLLTQAEPLFALGVARSPNGATFDVETADGRRERIHLAPREPSQPTEFVTIGPNGRPAAVEPPRGLRLSMLDDVAYLDFASYADLEKESAIVWSAIDRAGARALIIDFRKNRGGSLAAGREYISYAAWARSQLNRAGCLFVLTGPATFSAAMTNVTDLRRETEATIVGLPTGARPNGYQENKLFTLPNSRLRVSAAQRRYRFGSPGDTAVMPDLWIEQTIDDWRRGRDTTLEAALSSAQGCRRLSAPAD
jgi:hypothetical protein